MPEWNYTVIVNNELDRPLKLINGQMVHCKSRTMPDEIKPGESSKYNIYSPGGTSYGIEFYLSFKDVAPKGEPSYGTMDIRVDMPVGKRKNTSNCTTTKLLTAEGFEQVPDGYHDFQTSVTVSTAL